MARKKQLTPEVLHPLLQACLDRADQQLAQEQAGMIEGGFAVDELAGAAEAGNSWESTVGRILLSGSGGAGGGSGGSGGMVTITGGMGGASLGVSADAALVNRAAAGVLTPTDIGSSMPRAGW